MQEANWGFVQSLRWSEWTHYRVLWWGSQHGIKLALNNLEVFWTWWQTLLEHQLRWNGQRHSGHRVLHWYHGTYDLLRKKDSSWVQIDRKIWSAPRPRNFNEIQSWILARAQVANTNHWLLKRLEPKCSKLEPIVTQLHWHEFFRFITWKTLIRKFKRIRNQAYDWFMKLITHTFSFTRFIIILDEKIINDYKFTLTYLISNLKFNLCMNNRNLLLD